MKKLIEKFLAQELSTEEANDFLQHIESDNLAEKAYIIAMLKEAFTKNDDNKFRRILEEVEFESQFRENCEVTRLQKYFDPVEVYESQLKEILPSSIKVLSPQNNVNCNQTLFFELKKALDTPLLLIIEDNHCRKWLYTEIPPHLVLFEVNLTQSKYFHPGRFYWKLMTQTRQLLAMGVFFIGKGLML